MRPLVLGIDAGFQAMGLVVVDVQTREVVHALAVRTERTATKRGIRVADDDAERCKLLADSLAAVVRGWRPYGAVVELPNGGAQGARANRAMGMATGIVASVLYVLDMPTEWVTPSEVKKAATGRKDAAKEDVQRAVLRQFAWRDGVWPRHRWEQEHVADAAAAVLAAQGGTLLRMVERMVKEGVA